jgi:ABC-type sulfate/molybdate transport systems ATPase subunit
MPADGALHVKIALGGAFPLEVDLDAPPGVTILFGPSGCGKSTTLAAIAGLLRPTSGKVALGNDVWFDSDAGIDRPVHERRIAFVFQSLALFPHMTAWQNVAYGMPRDVPPRERRDRARALLTRLKVSYLELRKPATFSGGEAQRVALARAFATAPRAALFDEPFSAMDRVLRKDLVADLRGFIDELGIPLVHVTHHRHEARALGDRVAMMERGRVVRTGSVDDLLPAKLPFRDMTFDDTPMASDLEDEP